MSSACSRSVSVRKSAEVSTSWRLAAWRGTGSSSSSVASDRWPAHWVGRRSVPRLVGVATLGSLPPVGGQEPGVEQFVEAPPLVAAAAQQRLQAPAQDVPDPARPRAARFCSTWHGVAAAHRKTVGAQEARGSRSAAQRPRDIQRCGVSSSACRRQPGDHGAREGRAVVARLDQGAQRFHDALGAVDVDHRDAQPQQRRGPVQRLGDARASSAAPCGAPPARTPRSAAPARWQPRAPSCARWRVPSS